MKSAKLLKVLLCVCLVTAMVLSIVACGGDNGPTPNPDDGSGLSVTFNYNYDGAPAAEVKKVNSGKTVSVPLTATRASDYLEWSSTTYNKDYDYEYCVYSFTGWYEDADCTAKFNSKTPITADKELFAGWSKKYVFEAELVDLTDKEGAGYSYQRNDEQLIRVDNDTRAQNASFGYSVGYLYEEDLSITFLITSDADVNNVKFTGRFSSEYVDMYIADSDSTDGENDYHKFSITVNDTAVEYGQIALTGAKRQLEPNQRPFTNHLLGNINLKKGVNEITLTVANHHAYESTIRAAAPMIDCLYIESNANLTWSPKWSNMDKTDDTEG